MKKIFFIIAFVIISVNVNVDDTTSLSSAGGSLQDALTFGCRVAGAKCGFHGYDGIAEKFSNCCQKS